jgi:hypothetical protein
MRFNEIQQPSKLCNACNGSGRITSFMPICEKCFGYGALVKGVTPIKVDLLKTIHEGMSMSDLAYILQSIRAMPQVRCRLNFENFTIKLEFGLDNTYGAIWFKPRNDGTDIGDKFRRKVTAAAIARMGGKRPSSLKVAQNMLNGLIKNASIKILTNPQEWEVTGLRWDSFKFGEGLN